VVARLAIVMEVLMAFTGFSQAALDRLREDEASEWLSDEESDEERAERAAAAEHYFPDEEERYGRLS